MELHNQQEEHKKLKDEVKKLEHLVYMNHLTLQIKNYKNRILKDIYKNFIESQTININTKNNIDGDNQSDDTSSQNVKKLTYAEFMELIIKKERFQYNS